MTQNTRQLKPLRKYDLTLLYEPNKDVISFEADDHLIDNDDIHFYNAGNVIRSYLGVGQAGIEMVITPIE